MSDDRRLKVKTALELALDQFEEGEFSVPTVLRQAFAEFKDPEFARANGELLDVLISIAGAVSRSPDGIKFYTEVIAFRLSLIGGA